jgi:mRNA-degrading endonuclease toxin of MazEF toxin-antitoxin module
MKCQRGAVVLLDHPFSDAKGSKVRPVLVVQADRRNAILDNTIVAMISKNTSRVGVDPTQLLIDIRTPDGQKSGLKLNSAVTCGNLFTVHEDRITRKIGELSAALMQQVDICLKAALDVP